MFNPRDSVLVLLDILNIIRFSASSRIKRTAKMSIPSLSHSHLSMRALPKIDHRTLIMILVPVLVGIALIGFVIYFIMRRKKRREAFGPYEGTLVQPHDLAAQITPYGGSGPHRGRNIPRFSELIFYCGIYFHVLMTSYSTYSWGGHANCFS